MFAGPPLGISPCPSPITQRAPSARTLSRPLLPSTGLSGPMTHSPSNVHSPTSCCSQRCCFVGSVCIVSPPSRSVVDRLIGQGQEVAVDGRQRRRRPRALGHENRHHLLAGIAAPRGPEAAVPAVLAHGLARGPAPGGGRGAEA